MSINCGVLYSRGHVNRDYGDVHNDHMIMIRFRRCSFHASDESTILGIKEPMQFNAQIPNKPPTRMKFMKTR